MISTFLSFVFDVLSELCSSTFFVIFNLIFGFFVFVLLIKTIKEIVTIHV